MGDVSTTKRRLRWLLVLGLVLVPGAVLSVVTWRLIGQERELGAGRLAERRALVAARIAQRMLSRLELERAAARSVPARGAFQPDSGVLVLVSPLTARGMSLPWEFTAPGVGAAADDSGSRQTDGAWSGAAPPESAEYLRQIREGETLEFARGRPDLAAQRYAAAVRAAGDSVSRWNARLLEARALARAGRASDAAELYRTVAAVPSQVRDPDGMPLALYGAEGLLSERPADSDRVVGALETVAGAPDLGPPALYALRDLARSVAAARDSVADPHASESGATIERARAVEQSAAAALDLAGRILDFRRDLPALLSLAGADTDSLHADRPTTGESVADDPSTAASLPSAWRPWGTAPWLVSVTADRDRRLVLVADPVRLLRAIADEAADTGDELGATLSQVALSTRPGPAAELLGPGFPAVFAILPDAALQTEDSSSFGRVLLTVVLPLVLAVTILAAFLLWRDVRREIEIAGMRAQFVSSVSHELKTPLTSIRMYAQTLLMGRHRADADRRDYLETIVNESERLTRLINNVLDFSRIERGGRTYRMVPTSLESIVNEAARTMSYPLDQGGFDLRVRIDDGFPDFPCDADALAQAILNLLSNAVKFSADSKLIELELVRENGAAAIHVRDHGHGIEKRHHDRIFERFFRTPAAESDGLPGTGLGLALVAHVVNAHGGRVEVDSEPGRGSTFTIRLPADGPSRRSDVPPPDSHPAESEGE